MISLIQTAEGALNETHSILQRMRELAVQSSNDTNTDTDRAELQKEVDQLSEELTRVANNTEFNTQKLLDGSFEGTFHIGANEGQNIQLSINKMDSSSLGVKGTGGASFEVTGTTAANGTGTLTDTAATYTVMSLEDYTKTDGADITWANSNTTEANTGYVLVDSDGNAAATSADGLVYTELIGTPGTNGDTVTFSNNVTSGEVTLGGSVGAGDATGTATLSEDNVSISGGTYTVVSLSSNATYGSGGWNVGLADSSGKIVALGATDTSGTQAAAAANVTNWVDTEDTSNSLITMTAAQGDLVVDDTITVSGKGIDVSTQTAADDAITTIQSAIDTVSAERSKLGAYQNRLDHTINNLGTSSENLTAAESRIRDVDYDLVAA